MEKYWHKLKYGYRDSSSSLFPTGDQIWDITQKYLHTGILEVAQQNYGEYDNSEIKLFVDIILQAGKDLHNTDEDIRQEAENYINSDIFEGDCALLGLQDEIIKMLLLKSVEHKKDIMTSLNDEICQKDYNN